MSCDYHHSFCLLVLAMKQKPMNKPLKWMKKNQKFVEHNKKISETVNCIKQIAMSLVDIF